MSPYVWDVSLEGMVGMFVAIETLDGCVREGKVTGTRVQTIKVNGGVRNVPQAIELNGDVADLIEFRTIRTMDLR